MLEEQEAYFYEEFVLLVFWVL